MLYNGHLAVIDHLNMVVNGSVVIALSLNYIGGIYIIYLYALYIIYILYYMYSIFILYIQSDLVTPCFFNTYASKSEHTSW